MNVAPLMVFISYSHDSREHADRVLDLANRLRADRVDALIDQYEPRPREGWPRWMAGRGFVPGQIEEATFVLLVCTETYARRVSGQEKPGAGRGVTWEANLIHHELYETQTVGDKYVPVLFAAGDAAFIPKPLEGHAYYRVDTEQGYEDLYRHLTGQPKGSQRELGSRTPLPPRARHPEYGTPEWAGVWMVPYSRNPFFTGREAVLAQLQQALAAGQPAALTQPQRINALGGIGKTETAVEYAYRRRADYDAVLWTRADSELVLMDGYARIARELGLREVEEAEFSQVVEAVKSWLRRHARWLLILDDAVDLEFVRPFLSDPAPGQILLTTRAAAAGTVGAAVELDALPPEIGALFLLRRGRRLGPEAPLEAASPADREASLALTQELGGCRWRWSRRGRSWRRRRRRPRNTSASTGSASWSCDSAATDWGR